MSERASGQERDQWRRATSAEAQRAQKEGGELAIMRDIDVAGRARCVATVGVVVRARQG